ncbi:MAG: CDP-alcohol phosphatidyltransferase family protein [Firmicutes bacterium]|nr:CDP-alcohol phosphatidyltransferase family protein [Candidatus Colimorpha enterica]
MVADVITVSRILFSVCLFAFSPSSVPFAVLYLLCGISDVLDGYVARKLHTATKRGEILDTVADLFLSVVYILKILPLLRLTVWNYIWTAFIAVIKIIGIILRSKRNTGFCIAHSFSNKLTGFLLYILPMTVKLIDIKYSAAVVCTAATAASADELFLP